MRANMFTQQAAEFANQKQIISDLKKQLTEVTLKLSRFEATDDFNLLVQANLLQEENSHLRAQVTKLQSKRHGSLMAAAQRC